LDDDITELSNAMHDAFVSIVEAATGQNVHAANRSSMSEFSPSKGTEMTIFRVGYFPDFNWGDDAVLVGADRNGLRIFQSALRSAHEAGEATFELHGVRHRIVRQDNAADVELGSQTVVWRFDDTKLAEILDLLVPLVNIEKPAHQYFDDLDSPDATLIITVDEYVSGGPFSEFPQGMPVPPHVESQGPTA
jgi:hypothetical protein